ncbi:hypothetical protein LZ198_25730 [Myxococcus sp. K15C18031901]|uniref:hypothetical protein n=1 Tax=Myxococcus dinghuensis TaxID=2906761 RepID=UPI0020A74DB7|nr:hypothetical protein [Myxococcus dinghuensis]MCP3102275.1 hypothetical protein [Myxococcus dinghuensis]
MTQIRKPAVFLPPPVLKSSQSQAGAVRSGAVTTAASPARLDSFGGGARTAGPKLDEGALRRGPERDARLGGGEAVPVHQLLRSGGLGRMALGGGRDVRQATTPTPVATPTQVGTPTPSDDPRKQPLDVGALIANPAQAQATIDALKQSGDPQLVRYGETLARAVNNPTYQAWMKRADPPRIVLTTSAGNGNEPVLVLVPPDFAANPTKDRPVQTHYHGLGSPVGGHPDAAGTTAAIDRIWASTDPDPIFVLPETVTNPQDEHPESTGSHGGWRLSGPIDVARTTNDALAVAYPGTRPGDMPIGERVVSAHSRGGAALALSVLNDPDSLQADRLVLLDCLYNVNVALDPSGDTRRDVDAVLGDWVRAQQRQGHPVPAMVFFQNGTTDDPLEQAVRDAGGSYQEFRRESHMALNEEGMGFGYPANEPAATPTPAR